MIINDPYLPLLIDIVTLLLITRDKVIGQGLVIHRIFGTKNPPKNVLIRRLRIFGLRIFELWILDSSNILRVLKGILGHNLKLCFFVFLP